MKNYIIALLGLIFISMGSLNAQETVRQTVGPEGIWTRVMAVHPDGSIFISAQDGSFYQSVDQGNTWELKSVRNSFAEAMVVTDSGHIFIGSSRVYKSTDMAVTWEESNSGIPSTTILSMLFNKFNGDIIVGTYNNGIYISHDNGATWEAKNSGLTDYAGMRITSLYQHENGYIYATGTNYSTGYIYRSTNHGEIWEVISDAITDDMTFSDLTVTSDSRLYVVTWYGSVYRSDPDGNNFELATSGLRPDSYRSISVLAGDILLIGTTFEGIYRSDSYGDIWMPISDPGIYGLDCWEILHDKFQDVTYVSMKNAGLFRSTGVGDVWEPINNGLVHTDVDDIVITEDNTIFAGVFMGGLYRSYDDGAKWERLSSDINISSVNALAYKPGYLFAGISGSGVYISTNDGESWNESGLNLSVGWVSAMAIGPSGEVYAGLTTGAIHRSEDNGASWSLVYDAGDEILDLILNPHTNTMFAAVDDPSDGGVHLSTNGGLNWSRQISGLGSNRVRSLAVSPIENKVYASTADNGIFVSEVNGVSWEKPASNGLPNWISAVAINSKGEIFAGGNKIYSSRDGGENYNIFSEEPSTTSNAAFVLDQSEVLYIGTVDRGVWRSLIPTTARSIYFTVKMLNEDGFNPSSQSVAVGGDFNNWAANDFILTSQDDEEMTYTGSLILANSIDVVGDGFFKYKYLIPPDNWEIFNYDRMAEWDGNDDLYLDTVWFNNQKDFTRMHTSAIMQGESDSRGVSWADYDNDGDEDVIITTSGSSSMNQLFQNNGDGSFTLTSTGPVVTDNGDSRTACWGDYDNDGFVDLYITNMSSGNNFLYKNNGDGGFTRIIPNATVLSAGNSISALWADFDNDGYLDLFVANSGGETNELFMNNQDGSFMAVTGQSLVTEASDSRGCSAADYDNDGDIDIFIANSGDGENNFLYRNDQFGIFTKVSIGPVVNDGARSSGGSWGDYDNDGWLDLYVTNEFGTPNMLYKNNMTGGFTLVGTTVIPADSTSSSGSSWIDVDNDGLLDLYVANLGDQANILYKQRAGGVFSKIITGPQVEDPVTDARGVSWADYNNDGSPDLIQAINGGKNGLYRNNVNENHFIRIKLIGTRSNVSALGARVVLFYRNTEGNPIIQRRDVLSQTGFLGQNSGILTFGLGSSTAVDSLVVFWPGGRREVYSTNSSIDQLLTITETNPSNPPPIPTVNFPQNGATDIFLNPTLSWNQAGDASLYHIRFADNNAFSPLMFEDSVIVPTWKEVSGLQYDQSYYWQVRAKNDAGWGPWSSVWSFTTVPFSGTLNAPILTNPQNEQQGVPIPAPLSWTSEVSGTFNVQIAEDDLFNNLVYSEPIMTTEIFVDRGFLEYSTTYYWRVNVIVAEETSPWSAPRLFTTQPDEIDAIKTINFPQHDRRDEFSSSDYLMIGLPGGSNVRFRDVFADEGGENWMAYWDNGQTGNPSEYFVAYDGSDVFRFDTGRAFWVIHNGPISIDQKIPIASLNDYAQTEVTIHFGWNMITNPFGHRVSWEAVKQANNITADIKLWRYDRSNRRFTEHTHLEPMEGFYFNNPLATRTILIVPYVDSFAKPVVYDNVSWHLDIELTSGETIGASARIGAAEKALTERDDLDYVKPHGLADLADVYFKRPEWDDINSKYGSDIRPHIKELDNWEFQVYTPTKNGSTLEFPGLSTISENYEVYLIDKTRLTYQNLRDDEDYEFEPTQEISNFEIVVGEDGAVDKHIDAIIPMTYSLDQNYPNPFNPTTTIPFTLPEQTEVTLKVFNILGQEVVTVFKGLLNAGRHFFRWEGTNQSDAMMPSGIYIYQMTTATGFKFTGKMVLIK